MSIVTPGVALPERGRNQAQARLALGLPLADRLLLLVANDYARKGLVALLEAMVCLPPDLRLVVVGHAAQERRFRELGTALGVGSRVHFLGSLANLGPAYEAADILVHPTLDDTFAMVVLEALAHALPVVVSGPAQCGISALLRDGHDALLLTDPQNSGELATTLMRLLADPDLQQRLSVGGRSFAQAHTWERAAAEYERLYRASLA